VEIIKLSQLSMFCIGNHTMLTVQVDQNGRKKSKKKSTWCSSAKRENIDHIPQILRVSLYYSLASLDTR